MKRPLFYIGIALMIHGLVGMILYLLQERRCKNERI